jgi:AcrR family transcriptional regulator
VLEATRTRRTQAERTAETRERLLAATIDCVAEQGYASASTTEIVRRAGVSRGAQVHHFPTKADLVLAAVEWMFDRRLEEYRAAFASLAPEQRTPANALELMWAQYQHPQFAAWLELAVAARTDARLAVRFRGLQTWFDAECRQVFASIFPEADDTAPFVNVALSLTYAALDGSALWTALGLDEDTSPVIEALKGLAVMFAGAIAGTDVTHEDGRRGQA